MNAPSNTPTVERELLHPLLRVRDIQAAVAFYINKLGYSQGFLWEDPPNMVGVNQGGISVHLARRGPGNDSKGGEVYFVIGHAGELHAFHQASGVEIIRPRGDRPYELRNYFIRDPDGNEFGFGHRIHGAGDPIPIERVEVSVRLEKRLVGLLHDLAEHKGMSLACCLEETLPHTFEPLGEGIAPNARARYSAATSGHFEVAKQLLERGAKPKLPRSAVGHTTGLGDAVWAFRDC